MQVVKAWALCRCRIGGSRLARNSAGSRQPKARRALFKYAVSHAIVECLRASLPLLSARRDRGPHRAIRKDTRFVCKAAARPLWRLLRSISQTSSRLSIRPCEQILTTDLSGPAIIMSAGISLLPMQNANEHLDENAGDRYFGFFGFLRVAYRAI